MSKPAPVPQRPSRARVLAAVAVAGVLLGAARVRFIRVVDQKQGSFRLSSYSFQEEDSHHPRLRLLRQREKLDQVIAPGRSQFEKIVLLRKWAHEQWPAGSDFYYPPFDAVEILDLARKHRNHGFCAQYAVVFLQACRSFGLHARYVDTISHFATGVWSDEFDRWVLMDPASDAHFERDGVPLRGRDLYAAYWAKDVRGILRVGSDGSKTPITLDDARIYANYSILMRSDQLSNPGMIMVNGKMRPLEHLPDYRGYPFTGRDQIAYGDRFLAWHTGENGDGWDRQRHRTSDPDDLREVFNETIIHVAERLPDDGMVKIRLFEEGSPDFESFHITVDDKERHETSLRLIAAPLAPGLNKFAARVKTKSGWLGPESWVKIYYKPAWRFPGARRVKA